MRTTYKLWIQVEPQKDGEPADDLQDILGYLGEVDTLEERTRRFISSSLWKKKYPLRICRRLWMQTRH